MTNSNLLVFTYDPAQSVLVQNCAIAWGQILHTWFSVGIYQFGQKFLSNILVKHLQGYHDFPFVCTVVQDGMELVVSQCFLQCYAFDETQYNTGRQNVDVNSKLKVDVTH